MEQQGMSGQEKYRLFRDRYPEFIYDHYDIEETEQELAVTYHFQIPGLAAFVPVWHFPKGASKISDPLLADMLFSLGMVELISYWKSACPPRVVVRAGALNTEQIRWWKDLYYNGLGEFFYVNRIQDADSQHFMEIEAQPPGQHRHMPSCVTDDGHGQEGDGAESAGQPDPTAKSPRLPGPGTPVLVPIGGGKDSVVTLELLKEGKAQIWGYIINPRGATLQTASTAQIPAGQLLVARRTLDEDLLELNRQGFLNGHTPFSAIVAFSSLIAARLHGLPYIALSNESSANESTVQGSTVNHQYSKSFQFEKDFHHYTAAYLPGSSYYFSLLRPLSEFQIAAYFARCKAYHPIFRSCNVGSKKDEWCGHCPKCLFVYLILSPFLEQEEVAAIFGKDLLADETLKGTLEQLVGIQAEKPFECVGSRDEVNTAIMLTIRRIQEAGKPLPELLAHYMTTDVYERYRSVGDRYRTFFDEDDLVPMPWKELVRARCLWT